MRVPGATNAGRLFHRLLRDERGATMVEYALMLVLIALVCFLAVQVLGTSTSTGFANQTLNNALSGS